LSLWPCLSWFFVLIVGVLWVFNLQWHQLLSWVLLLYLPPRCYPLSLCSVQWMTSEETGSNNNVTTSTTRRCYHLHQFIHWSKLKKRSLSSHIPLSHSLMKIQDRRYWRCNHGYSTHDTKRWKTIRFVVRILFVSLLLVFALFESRDEILFRGVDL
jgi:hypothetical protein